MSGRLQSRSRQTSVVSTHVAGVSFFCVLSAIGAEPTLRTFRLPHQVEIAVPGDWKLVREEELRGYEVLRDSALEREGLISGFESVVPFQAKKRNADGASIAAMLTFLPAEASQEEVAAWPVHVIHTLGQRLGEAQRQGLVAAGAREISVQPATRAEVGGKFAVRFMIAFVGSDGELYKAEKYFIYTSSQTVVLTFQWTGGSSSFAQKDRDRILSSVRVW